MEDEFVKDKQKTIGETDLMNQYLESRKKIGAGLTMTATTNTNQINGHDVGSMLVDPTCANVNHIHHESVRKKKAGICSARTETSQPRMPDRAGKTDKPRRTSMYWRWSSTVRMSSSARKIRRTLVSMRRKGRLIGVVD